jgi:subtilisin-like proprotein convertase family protein
MSQSSRQSLTLLAVCLSVWCSTSRCQGQLQFYWENRATAAFTLEEKSVIDEALGLWSNWLTTPKTWSNGRLTRDSRWVTLNITREVLSDANARVRTDGQTFNVQSDRLGNPTSASIAVNSATDFRLTPNDDGDVDLLRVVVHEMGHALGFTSGSARFASRVRRRVYNGDGFTEELTLDTGGAHVADDRDLMSKYGGSMLGASLADLAILNDASDCGNSRVFPFAFSQLDGQIQDLTTRQFPFTISEGADFVISDVDVALRIDHTWNSDLEISLVSPEGTRAELSTDNGRASQGYGTDSLWARFDDEAFARRIQNENGAISGSYSAKSPLAAFDGENTAGQWFLEIRDDAKGNEGTLSDLALIVTTQPQPGDYNGDGSVGPEDDYIWETNIGSAGPLAAVGDANAIVGTAGYGMLPGESFAGAMASSSLAAATLAAASLAAVPEPTAVVLWVMALLSMAMTRRKDRCR